MKDIVERLRTECNDLMGDGIEQPALTMSEAADEIETQRRQLAEKDAEIADKRTALLDTLSDVLDAKEAMVSIGIEQASFPDMFKNLLRKLAEKDAEIERLKAQVFTLVRNEHEARQQLVESQALVTRLREALDAVQQVANRSEGIAGWHLNGGIASWDSILPEVDEALALPSDNTALREMIAKAGEVMRERCVAAMGADKGPLCGTKYATDAIRALPGVTLEDLQG